MFASSDANPSVWLCEPQLASFASGFRAPSLQSNCTAQRPTAGRGVCRRGRDAVYPMSVIITIAPGRFTEREGPADKS